MKTFTWILFVVVIVAGFVFLSKDKKKEDLVDANPSQSAKVMEYEDGKYAVSSDSVINWTGSMLNKTKSHTGTISVTSGDVEISNSQITKGSLVIDMNSITEDPGAVVDHLKSDDFFGVEKYPTAEFVFKSVAPREDISVGSVVTGDLTIKGITKEISVPVLVAGNTDGGVSITGEFSIDRSLFEIKYGSSKFFSDLGDKVIDDQIQISLDLVLE